MRIITVLGARPQFIKAAPVSKALGKAGILEKLIHTGQHYDFSMSELFFRQLGIPEPSDYLGLGGGRHGRMTGEMLGAIEEILVRDPPDAVLVYGDTNSTLAGALAAAKLNIPVIHIEAGLRSYNRRMPEELNRILTDHLAALLFCSSVEGVRNLAREGIREHVCVSGDVMADASSQAREMLREAGFRTAVRSSLPALPDQYYLLTLHRAENTDSPARMERIFAGLAACELPIVFPVHPRTEGCLAQYGLDPGRGVLRIPPVGYFEMSLLLEECAGVLTDSGGLQKEAYWAGRRCLTLRDETEWVETLEGGWNTVVGADREAIQGWFHERWCPGSRRPLYGEGEGIADRIAAKIWEQVGTWMATRVPVSDRRPPADERRG